MAYIILLAMVFFIGMMVVTITKNSKNKKFKTSIVEGVLETLFEDLTYTYDDGFSRTKIRDTNLINKGNVFSSSDYIRATYKGVPFEFSNVYVANETKDGEGNSSTTVYFRGQWLVLNPTRKIKGELFVIDRHLRHSSPHKEFIFFNNHLEQVHTESADFNKEFRVFASDPQEAFYVLTPPKMEQYLKLHNKDISTYQNDKEINIAIFSNTSLLEIGLFDNIDDPKHKDRIIEVMERVMSYIDYYIERG